MRLLVLNYEFPPLGGGGAPVCAQLCEHFANRGHHVDVVTMGFRDLPAHEQHNGVRITRVPALRRRAATCETHEMMSYVASALPLVAWRLSKTPYDCVHTHFVIPTGLLAYAATRANRTPYVITAHGSDIPAYNPDRFAFEHRFTGPLLKLIMRNAAALTSPSQYWRSLMLENCGPFDIHHIPNGIDLSRFTPRTKRRRILMSGRLLPRKGFQDVLLALARLQSDHEVHVAGDGPLRPELERIARESNLPVTFHGWLEHDSPRLTELYESAEIFCLPSERENASVALLEAMLAGTAIVTSNTSGCPETVGDAGVVVPPHDVAALAEALGPLLRSRAECARLGALARHRVEQRFDWDSIGDNYLRLFAHLADRAERGKAPMVS